MLRISGMTLPMHSLWLRHRHAGTPSPPRRSTATLAQERHPRAGGDLHAFALGLIKHNQTLRYRTEIPDNASHFRDDVANVYVRGTVIPAQGHSQDKEIPDNASHFRDDIANA